MKRYVLTKDKTIRLSTPQDKLNADIDKTSDNLIDLAEVGDCVEWLYDNVTEMFHIPTQDVLENTFRDYYKYMTKEEQQSITAIWKRNGDVMRRYGVE